MTLLGKISNLQQFIKKGAQNAALKAMQDAMSGNNTGVSSEARASAAKEIAKDQLKQARQDCNVALRLIRSKKFFFLEYWNWKKLN